MQLTPSQKKAEEEFMDFLVDPSQKEMVISGFAGTGKTWLVQHLCQLADSFYQLSCTLDNASSYPQEIVLTATTNKAAKVLENQTSQKTSTIHSLLNLKVQNDYSTGKVKLIQKSNPVGLDTCLVFVDEASMVDLELLQYIRASKAAKIVFVGDKYQLPPVGESKPVVFDRNKGIVHLEDTVRQEADNPIIGLGSEFRELLDTGIQGKGWPVIPVDNKHVFHLNREELKQQLNQFVDDGSFHSNEVVVLTWSNDRAISYNKYIRKMYTSEEGFVPGEIVITNSPVFRSTGHAQNTQVFGTDWFLRVDSCVDFEAELFIQDYLHRVPGWQLRLTDAHITGSSLDVFMPKNRNQQKDLLKRLAEDKNWPGYFRLKETWADVRSTHALTCHKSQGSTYRDVIIDLDDIGKNTKWREMARMLYVAVSRASHRVYFYGSLPDRQWKS
jgi:superfamily I DNA/RNA helicase